MAGVSAGDIQYVEAHGTGTSLGDPIEVAALTKAFRETTDATGFCALGSVKTNIGHLDAGAGIAGVIKTALSLERGEIPPSLHYHRPNPQIDFDRSPFFVNASLRPWPEADVRRAGVSSFGLGGTNVHVVMEEAPHRERSGSSRPHQLLLLSARSEEALDEATRRLGQHLERCAEQSLADVAFTLQRGRRRFSHRRVLVCDDRRKAAEILKACEPRRLETKVETEQGRPVAFLFPGGGAQYVGMGRQLYAEEPVFKNCIDRCAGLLQEELGRDLRDLIFADDDLDKATAESERPSCALPMLFSVEYVLAQLWMDWGIKPSAMIGHSMGEYTAACVAGVITLEQGLGKVALRGRLFERLPEGAMASVPLLPDEARRYIPSELDIAAVNRPDAIVASGAIAAIDQMQRALESQEIPSTRIHINVAAHSRLVEPILEEFEEHLRSLDLLEPQIPYISNVTGTWIRPDEATDPRYWVGGLRQTVRFSEGLTTIFGEGDQSLLEVGPGQTLSTFARQHPDKRSGQVVVPSLRHVHETIADDAFLLAGLGRLWMGGADVDWARFSRREPRHRVPLPTYPFERIRYWADPRQANTEAPAQLVSSAAFVADEIVPQVTQEGLVMSEPPPSAESTRKERVVRRLREIVEDLTGLSESEIYVHASFLELGLDSLMLTQATTEFQREFDVKITFRQLFESARTLDELAGYIDGQLPAAAPTTPPNVGGVTLGVGAAPAAAGSVERLIQQQQQIMQQLQVMQQQLGAVRGADVPAGAQAPPISPRAATAVAASPPVQTARRSQAGRKEEPKGLGPWKPIEKGPDGGLTSMQQAHLDALVERFNAKTPESKRLTQKYRARLSDPRTVAGFRQQWKELVYPIWSDRAKGSKLWDVDGNEWLDITMGFGVTLFGHSPDFITDAISQQLSKTIAIGPQTVQVGEVAEMICELTGMDRAAFCNTGSEAVLGAIRTARTVTGRDLIVSFSNDYHGIFDEVLVRGVNVRGEIRPRPVAPGIPRGAVQNVVVLDYGEDASLEAIRARAGELAAVLVEPVQSRNPALQPREFLQNLRALTEELDIPLIFDEMITGFRLHPKGAQQYFGVKADIATYGKVIGGGMPIGVVAGKARYLDALDAGDWSFGDDSAPAAGVTWFAGTFVRHPLSIAAAHAALKKLVEEGPDLQRKVNEKIERYADDMNAWFDANQYPIRIVHFSSLFLIQFEGNDEFAPLYWHHLRDMGIHTHERRPNFLTAAHSDQDMARLTEVCKEAARQLRAGGFLALPRGGNKTQDAEPWQAPATEE